MRLSYDPVRQSLRLVLPPRAPITAARLWAQEQDDWIARQIAKADHPAAVTAGTCLPWRGDVMLVDWHPDHPRVPSLVGGAPSRLELGGAEAGIGRRVGRWMRARALHNFTDATTVMAARAGLRCSGVAVGDPRRRWGSCSASGEIRYSWRIIMAPDFVQTALVAHEVAHLAHLNHGAAFHRLVDELVGDMAGQSRNWLRTNGPALHRWRFE